MTKLFFLSFIIACLPVLSAHAQVDRGLVLQPRELAMGGTGVALADDEFALFNNPAGLAGQDTRRFKLVGLSVEGSADAYSALSTSYSTFKNNFQISDLDKLMGKNINLRADMVPILQLPHFAITYLYDVQGSLLENNLANPNFQVGDMITHGVQAAYGWNLLDGGKKATEELRLGFAGKVLWRKGGFYDVSTSGFLEAASNGKQYIDNLTGTYGMGFGGDAGLQYVNKLDKNNKLFFGASVTDIGNTKFSSPQAAPIPMNISLGVGAEKKLEVATLKFDFDLRNLSQETAFVNKTHLGAELALPLLSFQAGLSGMNPTYGVSFDIWILRVSASSYVDEFGIDYNQDTSRNYLLQVDFNLPI